MTLAGVLAVAGAWYGTQYFAQRLAFKHTQHQADLWKVQVTSLLKLGSDTYNKQSLFDEDKKIFRQLIASSDVYRVVLYNAKGRAFWSSHHESIGMSTLPDQFARVVAGNRIVQHGVKQARDIESLERWMMAGRIHPQAMRNVANALVPVFRDQIFVGALSIYLDTTDLIAWNAINIEQATLVLCGVFALIFVIAVWLMAGYVKQRRIHLASVSGARDEAVQAEAEARGMADQLQKVNDDVVTLNKQLSNNVRQLHEAQEEIIRKGKMAQLGQLTATVAHDLRNPLGVVRTAAYLIARKTEDKDIGIERALERINNGITRCDNIITELLDFSRSKALQREACDMDGWVTALLEEQAPRLPDAVTLEFHQGLAGAQVSFDPGKMQRCLVNMLSNASEAMVGDGKDPAAIATPAPKIIVSTAHSDRGFEIRVRDNGPGITEENLAKIMEPLFTTKSFGVGLGLPAIEKVLEQHGGGLDIESEVGNGTTMIAWFPANRLVEEAA